MGVGVVVSRALSLREEGIQQEWCWAEKFWSLVGAGKERSRQAGGFLYRPGYEEAFSDLSSHGSLSTVTASLTFLFHDVLDAENWGHCCSTGYIRTGFVLSALCWHGTFPSCMIPFFVVVFGWLVVFLWVGYSLDYSHLCQLSCSFSPVPDRHICVQAIPLDKMIHSNHCVGQKCEAGQCWGVWPKGFRTAGDLLLLQVL